MKNTYEFLIHRLERPAGMVDAVLDTDAYNEIDDQFALAYMLKSPEIFNLKAVNAAPFLNDRSVSPEDGMEKSYHEIFKILDLAEASANIYKGSRMFLSSEEKPVVSPAAENIVRLAAAQPEDRPLYVIAIGAITNVASAILMEPSITKKIAVAWLGGHSLEWPSPDGEFNMKQDVAAARVVLESTAPVIMFPCMGVVSSLTTTGPELRFWLAGKNKLSDYLAQNTIDEAESYAAGKVWSRVIWDAAPVSWFVDPGFVLSRIEPAPIPSYDHLYSLSKTRHPIRYAYHVNRDAVFGDLFARLIQ